MKIPHVDVQAQYSPLIPELKEAFARTLETGRFIFGPEVEAFEREAAEKLGTADTVNLASTSPVTFGSTGGVSRFLRLIVASTSPPRSA